VWPYTNVSQEHAVYIFRVRMNTNYEITPYFIRIGIATGWMSEVQFSARARFFLFSIAFRLGSGAHPASYPMSTGGPIYRG
jgi:hypothetical protein